MDLTTLKILEDSSDPSEPYRILLPLALILILGKVFSLLFKRIKVPEIVGFLIAGLAIGLFYFIPNNWVLTDFTVTGINDLAKIGVILILFTAGVETNIKSIKAQGVASMVITSLGVIVPMGLGFLCAFCFRVFGNMDVDTTWYQQLTTSVELGGLGVNPIYSDLYYGIILSATSVSITVATLKEIGQLEGPTGTALISAAIIDDIIGIILLSLVISLSGAKEGGSYPWVLPTGDGALSVLWLILEMLAFFAITIGVGILFHRLFDRAGKKWPHHRRLTIIGLAFAFLWAFVAEVFHVADITGAYFAGLIIAHTSSSQYIEHRAETTGNVLFTPIFFASVALKMYTAFGVGRSGTSTTSFTPMFIGFGFLWVLAGLAGKVIGAGLGAKICKFKTRDSLVVGVGMMARAEVLIVTAQEGIDAGLVEASIMPFCLGLIIISSFATPILLRALYKNEPPVDHGHDQTEQAPVVEASSN